MHIILSPLFIRPNGLHVRSNLVPGLTYSMIDFLTTQLAQFVSIPSRFFSYLRWFILRFNSLYYLWLIKMVVVRRAQLMHHRWFDKKNGNSQTNKRVCYIFSPLLQNMHEIQMHIRSIYALFFLGTTWNANHFFFSSLDILIYLCCP